jgi:AhpD family alkylhydroperoxidase
LITGLGKNPKTAVEINMKPLFKGLDTETQLLVAIGSAVASGCIPCLENISGLARTEGIAEKKLKAAAIIGQFVEHESNRRQAFGDPFAVSTNTDRLPRGID